MVKHRCCLVVVFLVVVVGAATSRRRSTLRVRCGASSVFEEVEEEEDMRALKLSADAAQREGSYEVALERYVEALSVGASDAALVASCHLNAARCCSKLGDDARAVEYCEAALAALEDPLVSGARSLRAAALYRRATARAALGETRPALDDASRAVTLGETRAVPLLRRLRPPPRAPLDTLLADPKRLAALLPLAKTYATPASLQALGMDSKRATDFAAFLHRLQPEAIERFLARLAAAITLWRRLARVAKTLSRVKPYAIYAAFLAALGVDSLKIIASLRT